MPAALQWLHRKRFQSAPNIKKPLKGPVIQANVNDQLHPLCPHKHHRRNNSNIFIINIIISKTNERLFMTCETKIPHELSHTRCIPVGRSLQSQGTRLASLAGRTTGLPALPPEKICQMLFFLYFLLGRLFSKSFQIFIFLSITSRSVYF